MASSPTLLDPRGPRAAAGLTTVVLALVLVTGSAWLLLGQTVVFALGLAGRSPYTWLFRTVVRPRLGPPVELEDARPVRFAQGVGLGFALLALLGVAAGWAVVAIAAVAAALAAAFLNAAFGVCLGCEVYLLARRANTARRSGGVTRRTSTALLRRSQHEHS